MRASMSLHDRRSDLRLWRDQFWGVTAIDALQPRQRETCVGVVLKIRLDQDGHLAVTVEDGSGQLTALFTGRGSFPVLELGRGMRLTATLSADSDDGLLMRNPAWTAVAGPYA